MPSGGATNVINAKRPGTQPSRDVKSEAEKDSVEFLQIIKAYSRAGDIATTFSAEWRNE